MSGIFQFCESLENLDLSNWDTSNVKNMDYMFKQCNKLKELKGLDKFNTDKLESMAEIFNSCNELEYLNLSG